MKQQELFQEQDRVYEAWNAYAPIKHSIFTKKMRGAVYLAIQEYGSADIIISAIKKYGKICSEPGKYWWTLNGYMLEGFIQKALTRFIDMPLEGFEKRRRRGDEQQEQKPSNLLPIL